MAKKTTAQLINADSGKTNYYTPDYIIDAASKTMGVYVDGIIGERFNVELDVASDILGNTYVQAWRYYTEQINGLNQSWVAESVWLNHPYSREFNQTWSAKAISEYYRGNAKQICMLTWASTSEKWAHPLLQFPVCFLNRRVKFHDPNGVMPSGSTKSSMVTYMGPNIEEFRHFFGLIGNVMLPSRDFVNGMTISSYQARSDRTSGYSGKVHGEQRIMCGAVGLSEEAGEVLGLHKKWNYHGHGMDQSKLSEELGDVFWYLSETASAWGLSLDDVARDNLSKLEKRYPDGFDRERSQRRDELGVA